MQAAYKTNPILSDNQTIFYQSAKNKDFSWTFLQKLLKLSTIPVPKDPCSKVRTFPGNKDRGNPLYVLSHAKLIHRSIGTVIHMKNAPLE